MGNLRLRLFVQDEAERLAETVRATFSLELLPDTFHLDETDFVHGLPKVLQHSTISKNECMSRVTLVVTFSKAPSLTGGALLPPHVRAGGGKTPKTVRHQPQV